MVKPVMVLTGRRYKIPETIGKKCNLIECEIILMIGAVLLLLLNFKEIYYERTTKQISKKANSFNRRGCCKARECIKGP
jgi:hypothetical protein